MNPSDYFPVNVDEINHVLMEHNVAYSWGDTWFAYSYAYAIQQEISPDDALKIAHIIEHFINGDEAYLIDYEDYAEEVEILSEKWGDYHDNDPRDREVKFFYDVIDFFSP